MWPSKCRKNNIWLPHNFLGGDSISDGIISQGIDSKWNLTKLVYQNCKQYFRTDYLPIVNASIVG